MPLRISRGRALVVSRTWFAWAVVLAACSSSDTAPPAVDSGVAADARNNDATAPATAVGGFVAELKPATASNPAYTSVSGQVNDGPKPSTVVWELVEESGGCRLTKPRAPFCNPACGSGKLCVDDNLCAADPKKLDLGPVEVSGLGAAFTMTATGGIYNPPGDLMLPSPPAAEGAEAKVSASGGLLGAFSISSRVIAPLVSSGELAMEEGKPLKMTWTAPGKADVGRIAVEVDISHHGGTRGLINCDVADTGSLEIPATQISKLIALGVGGFPRVVLSRVANGSAAVAGGTLNFKIMSELTREATVAGVVSCSDELPCPGGKVCQANSTCAP